MRLPNSRAIPILLAGSLAMPAVLAAQAAPAPGGSFVNRVTETDTTVPLPEPSGPHRVGTVTYHWIDADREEAVTPDPNDLRQVIVQLYYPAAPLADPEYAEYVPRLDDMRAALFTHTDDLPHRIAEDLAARAGVTTSAIVGASLDRPARCPRYPVILISPGGNMSRHWHTALAQELASHGYVIGVLSHAFSGWDVFPAGGFIKSIDWNRRAEEAADASRVENELADMLAADARLALDRLTALDRADPLRRFTARLDLENVAIVGHSRGGDTVARTCSTDPRFDACVTFDNIGPDREAGRGLTQPQLAMRSADWPASRVARLHAFLASNRSESTDVAIAGAGHMSFTDLPIVGSENFGAEIDARRAHRIVSELTRAFLDRHLRAGPADLVERAAEPYPEVDVDRIVGGPT